MEGTSPNNDRWIERKSKYIYKSSFHVGIIGAITVSGLPQEDDHKLVVDVIERFLYPSA